MKKSVLLFVMSFLATITVAQTTVTVGSGGNYTNLRTAFNAINTGSITGSITLEIISSITDNNIAVLNASGTGSSNYTSVLIYPAGSGYILSGNIAGPVVSLNGADQVVIDGRVNAAGSAKDLVIVNTNTGTGASTIRFSNSAENNTVKFCVVKGAESNVVSGVILFSTSASGNGNDNNRIENNDITSDAAGRPVNAICSNGTSGRENSDIFISDNHIYNFFRPNSGSSGIYIAFHSVDWTISGNSFYETTTVVPTAANAYYAINISTSVPHRVTGNYIGGSAPECGGSPWTMNSNSGHFFYVLNINGGISSPVIVENNIIRNIDYTTVHRNPWDGIFLASGSITVAGNTIGATTGTGSIVITTPNASATATISGGVVTAINLVGGGSGFASPPSISFSQSGSTTTAVATATISGGSVTGYSISNGGAGYTSIPTVMFASADYSTSHGIRHATSGTVILSNNNIGAITTVSSTTYSHCFEGIVVSGSASVITISDNLIGSLTTANSIQTSSTAATSLTKQDLRGIYINSSVTTAAITGNTIANMHNAYIGTVSSRMDGTCTSGGSNTIQNNTIRNLSAASSAVLLKGIQQSVSATGTNQVVTGNTVYELSNTAATGSVVVTGIQYYGPITALNTVSANFVHSLSLSSSNTNAEIDGIVLGGGVVTCANNIIFLGNGITTGSRIYGIYDNSSGIVSNISSVYFNSIYINGTVASGTTSSTAALWNSNNTCIRNYRNNVLVNMRSGGTTGKHYAIRAAGTNGLTINYNDYYVSGGGILGSISGADKISLALWSTATGQDLNSLNSDPLFTLAGGTAALDYNTAAIMPGISISGITSDYHGLTRGATPKMGALEANNFIWQGTISTDFGTAGNWAGGVVPPAEADISFAASPANDCILDQNRILDDLTNAQSTYKLITNGHQLTINGVLYLSNGAQIDATSGSSDVVFGGLSPQVIPAGAFVSNLMEGLSINNAGGVTMNNDLTVSSSLNLINGSLIIGAHTLTVNGDITVTLGTLTGGPSANMVFGGTTATILPPVTLNNLSVNRTGGITLSGDVLVSGALNLTAGTLTVAANTFTISGSSPVRTTGTINASHSQATLVFANASAITLPSGLFTGNINNLTISGAGGITAGSDLSINGVLNLAAANPAATKGLLEMTIDYTGYPGNSNAVYLSSHILHMGASATTIGTGDVTGTIRRATILANTPYTFGHQYTTVALTTGTMPDALSVTVTIGVTPAGNPDAVKRTYEIVPEVPGGYSSASHLSANFHYLDSELTSSISPFHVNTESSVVTMDFDIGGGWGTPDEHGRSSYDFVNNYIGFSNIPISYFINIPGHAWRTLFQLRDYVAGYYTWDGSSSDDWGTSANWTPVGVPSDLSHVIIPDAATTPNDPVLPSGVTINTLTIERDGVLIMNNETLTIKNSLSGGWEDQNIQGNDPGTSTVVFSMPGSTISGNARFYNVIVSDGADITNQSGSTMKIANTLNREGSGKWYADLFDATIEYNGTNQVVYLSDAVPSYHHLILSGSGTKTLPVTMAMHGNLVLRGSVTATGVDPLTINGNLILEEGSTFSTGNFNHIIRGNIENSGIFQSAPGYSVTLNGNSTQSVLGDSATIFSNLVINNSHGVNVYSDLTVNNDLTLTSGNLTVDAATLGMNGTITQSSGLLDVSPVSSLRFGGSSPVTIGADLFTSAPSINNLYIQNPGGVSMNTDIIINNLLSIGTGKLTVQSGKSLTCGTELVNSASGELVNNGSLIVKGSVMNDQSSMAAGTGTLYINGLAEQTISGSQPVKTNNLVTENSSGIRLNTNLSISGTHTFVSGIITTSLTPNYVIYEAGSLVTGSSDGNHVNGWVKKLGNTDFVFPVGNGAFERTIALQSLSANSEFAVCHNRPVTPNINSLNDSLVLINSNEYWTIQRISGSAAQVGINWDNSKIAYPQLRLNDIRTVYFDGTKWTNLGGTATGDVAGNGSIISELTSNFNTYFSTGSISFVLPLQVLDFSAERVSSFTRLNWSIAEEEMVSEYELERSVDRIFYTVINRQLPFNQLTTVKYQYEDFQPLNGTVFYRLKIKTVSGKVIYSRIVAVTEKKMSGIKVISNPITDHIELFAGTGYSGRYQYAFLNLSGQVLQTGSVDIQTGISSTIILNQPFAAGSYVLYLKNSNHQFRQLILKQ